MCIRFRLIGWMGLKVVGPLASFTNRVVDASHRGMRWSSGAQFGDVKNFVFLD